MAETGEKQYEVIFLDQDGVLTEFVDGARKVLNKETGKNITMDDIREKPEHAFEMEKLWDLDALAFWDALERTPGFWSSLESYPWADYLYRSLKDFADRVCVCTAPPEFPPGYSQKVVWLQNHLAVPFRDIILTPEKHFLAKPGRLLIDDKESNAEKFREAGGEAALVPSGWNTPDLGFGDVWKSLLKQSLKS